MPGLSNGFTLKEKTTWDSRRNESWQSLVIILVIVVGILVVNTVPRLYIYKLYFRRWRQPLIYVLIVYFTVCVG